MSFRMRNTQKSEIEQDNYQQKKKYTQQEVDLVEEKYKEKELKMRRFVNDAANPLLDQYRQNLLQQPSYTKETIIYDQHTGKWKLVKEEEKI
jgi:hypothetical protein